MKDSCFYLNEGLTHAVRIERLSIYIYIYFFHFNEQDV